MKATDLRRILSNVEGEIPQIILVAHDPDLDITMLGPWIVVEVTVKPGVSFLRLEKQRAPIQKALEWIDRILKIFVKR